MLDTKVLSAGLLIVAGLSLSSCGKDSTSGDGLTGQRGVVQGVVIDAVTGARINLPDANGVKGINVLVNHTYKPGIAKNRGFDKDEAKLLDGEFYIGDIPVGQRYPITVNIPGYQSFDGDVAVPELNTDLKNACTTQACLDRVAIPTLIANIALYPVGERARDLELQVRDGSARIASAEVVIKPGRLQTDGVSVTRMTDDNDFLSPRTTRVAPLVARTNTDGVAMFKGKDLVLGQEYTYVVYPGRSDKTEVKGTFKLGAFSGTTPSFGLEGGEEANRFKVRVEI